MGCGELKGLLPLYDAEALGWWKRRRVQRHVDGCAECRRELSALKATADLIAQAPGAKAPVEVWRGIAAALDEEGAQEVSRGFVMSRRLAGGLAGAVLTAAAVVVGAIVLRTPPGEPHVFDRSEPFVRYHSILAQNDPLSDQVGLDIRSAVIAADKSDGDGAL